jgi:hypothetical protein
MKKGINKTCDPLFLNSIEKYDICFLLETHVGYNSPIKNIGPFLYHPICRPITQANNRYFGGLAILRKPYLKNHVKILKNTNSDYQWIKLDKTFFGFQKDIYICVVYFPPSISSYTKDLDVHILDSIEKDITIFSKNADILLCGDFNARIGTNPDYILNDDNKFIPIFNSYPVDKDILERHNKDTQLYARGKELLDVCIVHQLRVLNGRTLGDLSGNFTCFTPNGASAVDYAIVSESALNKILYFKIADFKPILSDCHCLLEWEMSASYCYTSDMLEENVIIKSMPRRYMWTEDSATLFQEALTSESVQPKINQILTKNELNTFESINNASTDLANIFIQAADLSLKKKKNSNKNNTKNEKWFNLDLKKMRNNLINYGKVYTQYPKDPYVKNHFYKLYREYNKSRKMTQRQYNNNMLKELDQLHEENTKTYWKIINDLKNDGAVQDSNCISPSVWLTHFKNLNEVNDHFSQRIIELEMKLESLENIKCFNELDFPITESEISNAILKIRLNKSPGLDNITNNMIRCSQSALIKCYKKNHQCLFSTWHLS